MAGTENRRIYIWINGKEVENSVKGISNEYRKNRAILNNLNRDTKAYHDQVKNVRQLKTHLDQHRDALNGVNKSWNLMKQAAAGVFAGNVMTAAMQKITNFIPELVSRNAELSDSITDVQKTTGLTDQQMDELMKRFKSFNTRTPRKELLALAAEAGKMGERGVGNIADKVEQLNEIVTALGDDLGEGAGLKISKMADLFETSMRNIGSGINAAADSSKANAGFLTEFLSRLAGVSKQVGIAAGDVLGYGTAIDEMGLNVEMSSTALNGFLIDFTKNTESFGKAAGFAEGELSALVGSQGTNAGFLAMLERLKATNPEADQFLRKLEEMGINGDRGSQVFLALAQNIEKVRDRQALANSEITKGTSITEEYQKRNNNLAANLEKIGKQISGWFASSKLVSGLESMTAALADTRTEAEKLSDVYQENKAQTENLEATVRPLIERYKELQEKSNLSKEEHNELNSILTTVSQLMPGLIGSWNEYNKALTINTDLYDKLNERQREVTRLTQLDAIEATKKEIGQLNNQLDARNKTYDSYIKKQQTVFNLMSAEEQVFAMQNRGLKDWNAEAQKWQDQTNAVHVSIANNTLRLHEMGVELTKEQKIMVDSVLGTNHFNLVNRDLNATMAQGVMDMSDYRGEAEKQRVTLEELKKKLEENIKARKELGALDMSKDENAQAQALVKEGKLLENQIKTLEIKLGLREADKAKAEEAIKRDNEYIKRVLTLYEQMQKLSDEYKKKQADALKTEYELLQEDYENRLISYEEFLDRKAALDMAASAKKRAEELQNEMPPPPTPSNFWEWIGGIDDPGPDGKSPLQKIEEGYAQMQQAYSSFDQIMQNLEARKLQAIDQRYNTEMEYIDRLHDSKMISDKSYDYEQRKLQEEADKRKREIQLRAFKREKAAAIIQAGINTALAATSALASVQPTLPAGLIAAGVVTGLGLLQVGAIASKPTPEFKDGTILSGPLHSQGGMPIINPRTGQKVAEVEGGETLLTGGVSRNPNLLARASALNVEAGGRPLISAAMRPSKQGYFKSGGLMPKASDGGQSLDSSNQALLDAINGMRADLQRVPTRVEAVVSLDSIEKGFADKKRADSLS